jgi:ankyrin repeat protein
MSATQHPTLPDQDVPYVYNPTLIRTNSTSSGYLDVKEIVEDRLSSSWGRPVHPPGGETSLMHQWISCIHPISYTTQQEEQQQQNRHNWNQIEERCRTHPHEAAHLDRRGRTCLSAACAKKPPVSTIQAILQACGRHGETILERDKHGRTPLTIAISSNADLEVIATLLEKCPKAASVNDHLGHLPLHLACEGYDAGQVELVRDLLHAFPGAASRESFNGRTPLHSAMEGRAPVQVVEQLVKGMCIAPDRAPLLQQAFVP